MNIAKLEQATKPHKGFGKPRRWLQLLDEDEEWVSGHNGNDEALHAFCAGLLQLYPDAVILVLNGACDPDAPNNSDTLAEYRTDRAVIGAEEQVIISAKEVAQLVN